VTALCSFRGCRSPRRARRLCCMHYQRLMKHGDPAERLIRAAGAGSISADGYKTITVDGKRVTENRVIAEKILGRPLPRGAEVSTVTDALVISPGTAYTKLLHRRLRAYEATGSVDSRQCRYCRKWDDPQRLYIQPHQETGEHAKCRREAVRARRSKRLFNLMRPTRASVAPVRWVSA
jgi:hypothetical protein